MTFTVNHQWGNAEDTVTGNCTWVLMHGKHTHSYSLSSYLRRDPAGQLSLQYEGYVVPNSELPLILEPVF